MQSIKDMLTAWNNNYTDRVKMQHAYVTVAFLGIIVAGLVGLVDDKLGDIIVNICVAALGIFIANVFAWAILYSLVIVKLPSKRSTTARK